MSLLKEIYEDITAYSESAFSKSKDRFEFNGNNGPIIGIHGVYGLWSKSGLRSYMGKYNVKGVLVNFGNLTDGIDSYLDALDIEVKKYPKAIVLGCSAGGLVAIEYAIKYGWKKFDKIITVATPFNGSPYANILRDFYPTFKEISPESNFLAKIKSAHPPEGKIFSLFASEDRHTNPEEISLNWPFAVLPPKAHGEIHSNYKFIEPILNAELGIHAS